MWDVDFIEENPCQIRMGRETKPNYGFPLYQAAFDRM